MSTIKRKPIGPADAQWMNPDGTPTLFFYQLIQDFSSRLPTKRVIGTTDPTVGQTLKYNATTDQYEPG